MEGGELRSYPIWRASRVSGAAFCCDRILILVIEPGIEKRPSTVHFGCSDVSVPVGHRSEAGPSVQVHAGQAKSWWDECPSLLAVRPQSLAVLVQFGIETPRPPARENF